jgi:hypothetical protein
MTGGVFVMVWHERSDDCLSVVYSLTSPATGNSNCMEDSKNIRPVSLICTHQFIHTLVSTIAWNYSPNLLLTTQATVKCDNDKPNNTELLGQEENDDDEILDSSGHTESERFFHALEYYRQILPEYQRQWSNESTKLDNDNHPKTTISLPSWPRNIPVASQIPALIIDLEFCQNSPVYQEIQRKCQDQQFKIASFYIFHEDSDDEQKKIGYRMTKSLAENGHPDGMCLLGKF